MTGVEQSRKEPAPAVSTSVPALPPGAWLDYLRLIRPPNLVTAAADILAGWLIAGGAARPLPWLIAASVCLYAGGVVLNDVFDRKLDAVERPERPLPSGRVSAPAAAVFGAVLLTGGVGLGLAGSRVSGLLALLIALSVLLYDAAAKAGAAGPFVMGVCRALNLALGLSATGDGLRAHWFLTLIPLVYIAAVTVLSRGEVHGGQAATARAVCATMLAVLVALALLPVVAMGRYLAVSPFVLLLAVRLLPPFSRAARAPQPQTIRSAVHAGIVSLIVVDACMAAAYVGLVPAAALLSLSVLTAELARIFAVT